MAKPTIVLDSNVWISGTLWTGVPHRIVRMIDTDTHVRQEADWSARYFQAVLPEMPLTITTVPVIKGRERPYEDEMDENGLLLYRYRGTDPGHRDNAGLGLAMRCAVLPGYLVDGGLRS